MLNDRDWQFKCTPKEAIWSACSTFRRSQDAARYDGLTGCFDAGALALSARGVAGLVRKDGRRRLVLGLHARPPGIPTAPGAPSTETPPMPHDDRELFDPDPAALRRKRYSVRRSVAMSEYMLEQIKEIAAINRMKDGVIMRRALNAGLPLVREAELAQRGRRRGR